MKRTEAGFTIVELLIVIVVIAILAAITIVSYNGIASRAQNSQLLGKVDAYTKALQIYKAQNSTYPRVDVAESGLADYGCLGSDASFPPSSPYADKTCYTSTSLTVKTSPTLMTQLKGVAAGLPEGVLPPLTSSDNSMSIRGILYFTNATTGTASLQYVIKGDQDCARGTKAYNIAQWQGMTVCTVTFS